MQSLHDYYYDLPRELIAQTPCERRDGCRLMVAERKTGEIYHRHFYDVIEYLKAGDALVINDSRVIPARLYGTKIKTSDTPEPPCTAEAVLLRQLLA